MQLSICIPTYNRAKLLKECLDSVINQVKGKEQVEIVICDNASPDDTESIVKEFLKSHSCIKYFKNPKNLGYAGNQAKCFKHSCGDYTAILCDDDVYIDGQVDTILKVVSNQDYTLIYLNYYSFIKNFNKAYGTFAPEKDVIFARAYDIMNYPSVGHFSGFVFNTKLAKKALKKILSKKPLESYEKHRGVLGEIAIRSTTASNLPAYFIGKRRLAARMPSTVDYDSLKHICLNYYRYFHDLYDEGIITRSDLAYRANLVLSWLPRAIISDVPRISNEELIRITNELSTYFKTDKRFYFISLPLLYLGRYHIIKCLFKMLKTLNRFRKYSRNIFYG